MREHQVGFTLIELLITILIALVLATAAMPSFAQFLNNQRLDAAARSIVSGFALARSEAIKRNAQVFIVPNKDVNGTSNWSTGLAVSVSAANTAGDCLSTETVGCIFAIPTNQMPLSVTVTPAPSNNVMVYQRSGRLTNADHVITLCPDSANVKLAQRIITINATGLPVISYGDACS